MLQKYLDYFADYYNNVCEIENRGVGIAYWNMYDYSFRGKYVSYKDNQWPIVFFHYSGIKVQVMNGVMTFYHTMYLTPIIRKTFVEPYADLMKSVYERYLNTPIKEIVITPLNKWNYCAKTIAYYLNKVLPIDWAITQVMRIKYRESHKPYSEK